MPGSEPVEELAPDIRVREEDLWFSGGLEAVGAR